MLLISCSHTPKQRPTLDPAEVVTRTDTQLVEKKYDSKLFQCTAPASYPARDARTGKRKQSSIAATILANAKARIDCQCQLNAVGVLLGATTQLPACKTD